MVSLWLPWATLRAPPTLRERTLASLPLERISSVEEVSAAAIGGADTESGALPVKTSSYDAALYSSRGRGYATYNEDAAFLVPDEQGGVHGAVFDQAGGLGGKRRGEASKVAAEELFAVVKAALSARDSSEIHRLMRGGVQGAHTRLVERREGEVTTGLLASVRAERAHLVNSGDSGAFLFDAQGEIKERTDLHEWSTVPQAGALTHAIGLVPEGPGPDVYAWTIEPGDWLLLCTDGLLDAGLGADKVARTLLRAESAEEAVNALCLRVLRRMLTLRSKPDNLTVVLVHALVGAPPDEVTRHVKRS